MLTTEEVLDAEQQLLNTLRFNICGPTVLDFVGHFAAETLRLVTEELSCGDCSSPQAEGASASLSLLHRGDRLMKAVTAHLCLVTLFSDAAVTPAPAAGAAHPASVQAAAIVSISAQLLCSTAAHHQMIASSVGTAEGAVSSQLMTSWARAVQCWSGYQPSDLQHCMATIRERWNLTSPPESGIQFGSNQESYCATVYLRDVFHRGGLNLD